MKNTTMIQKIQDMKKMGYTQTEVIKKLESECKDSPSKPTIRKYYQMPDMPKKFDDNVKKHKAFDEEPYNITIMQILINKKDVYISSIYDVLREKFESGEIPPLPGNEQTLRNYVRYLRDNDLVVVESPPKRIYDTVPNMPPGKQMLLDFGELLIKNAAKIHFICMLLRYSRFLIVFVQDHKFNSVEACTAIYRGFTRLGGRPEELTIDQDSVFVNSENYGEVIETQVFGDFLNEQHLRLWTCNKADPASKGGIENAVKFVKSSFFSARTFSCVDEIYTPLANWQKRQNDRIHKTTLKIPADVFEMEERAALQPLMPSIFENLPSSYAECKADGVHMISHGASKYSVPGEFANKSLLYKIACNKIYIYDKKYNLIAEHEIAMCKGSIVEAPEHRRPADGRWETVSARLKANWNCHDMEHFINGVKKENPRHVYDQLQQIENLLISNNPDRQFVARLIEKCCENFRYRFSQFSQMFQLMKSSQTIPPVIKVPAVDRKCIDIYVDAFEERSKGGTE